MWSCYVFLDRRIPVPFHFDHEFCIKPELMHRAFERADLMVILDGIDDAVVKLDEQANFAAMNQAAADIYQRVGLSFQTMKGKSIWEIFPDLKGTTVERELRSVIEDHMQASFEFYSPKDLRWYEIRGYPASPGAILVFHDITHKKSPPASS